MKLTQEITELMAQKALKMIDDSIKNDYINEPRSLRILRNDSKESRIADMVMSLVDAADAVMDTKIATSIVDDNILAALKQGKITGKRYEADLLISGSDDRITRNMANAFYGGSDFEKDGETTVVSANQTLRPGIVDDISERLSIKFINILEKDKDIIKLSQKNVDKETKNG